MVSPFLVATMVKLAQAVPWGVFFFFFGSFCCLFRSGRSQTHLVYPYFQGDGMPQFFVFQHDRIVIHGHAFVLQVPN